MTALQITLLLIAAIAGILAAWILRKKTHSEFLSILLSFSGAYLLGTVVLHLLPEIFSATETTTEHDNHITAVFVLAGFFIQLFIVQFTRGLEHGHMHLHDHHTNTYVASVVFGLSIHAFMEGIPLTASADSGVIEPVYKAILLHKVPEAFALATVLFFSVKNKAVTYILLALFAVMSPLGSYIGEVVTTHHMLAYNRLIAVVCGSLIHISTTIIFEASGKAHKISLYKLAAILVGAGIALAGVWTESH